MNLLALQKDPKAFRNALMIDSDSGPVRFADVMDPWQRADFEAMDDGWLRCVKGTKHKAKFQRAWLERPRGHSKSNDEAIMAAFCLFSSRRRLSGVAAAGDQDQARLLRDAISKLLDINPFLAAVLDCQSYKVVNKHTGSTLEIISSDAKTSYGITPDFVIADEIVHWKNRDLWDSLLSSAAKRSTCMLACITNAGLTDDWVWQTREAIRQDPSWHFSRLEGPVASWISQELLAEQERLLPRISWERLWNNTWTNGSQDWVEQEILDAAFNPNLRPSIRALPGETYCAGVDLSTSRDWSGICVVSVRRGNEFGNHGCIRLAYTKIWKPTKGKKIDLQEIENTLLELHQRFQFAQVNIDPWQASHMASRLQAAGMGRIANVINRKVSVPMVEVPPTGSNLQAIASAMIESFNDRRVELYDEPQLKRDLQRMRIEEKSYGFRLVAAPRTAAGGHSDLGTAFSLSILAASQIAARFKVRIGAIGNHGETAYDRALNEFRYRQQLHEKMQDYENNRDPQREAAKAAFNSVFHRTDRY